MEALLALTFTSVSTFRELLGQARMQQYRWIHTAPPCSSFGRAQRSDKYGHVPALRSARYPMGLPGISHPKLEGAHQVVSKLAKLLRTQHRAGTTLYRL